MIERYYTVYFKLGKFRIRRTFNNFMSAARFAEHLENDKGKKAEMYRNSFKVAWRLPSTLGKWNK